ncbi:hypothetical protein COLU111180_06335 [Cohnella lubricantis]|uniref:Phage protein n=1 Tax=Cohnella lubricantis TaxID=2163172 RepID=A0A841T7K8_9BACL|nr:hypothetical protein [Cohnella lubricantis]MBB6677503.1 hypothetical protein [Cohnella lubricantis]MBP2116611.1 ribosomal protein L17 [Cohnella lubricantis]
MARNKLGDLQNHLFEQLERLNDENLTGEQLETELKRAKAVSSVASQIIANGHLVLKAVQLKDNAISADVQVPKMLEAGDD